VPKVKHLYKQNFHLNSIPWHCMLNLMNFRAAALGFEKQNLLYA